MRRSLFLLMAAILVFLRVFVLGIAAVFAGMTDYGGVSSALLRIFQVYSLFFVYIVILQYLKPVAREFLRMPSLVVASASCVLSAFALYAFAQTSKASIPTDVVRVGGSVFVLFLLDFLVMGFLAMDGRRPKPPREERSIPEQKGRREQPQVQDNIENDTTYEVH